MMGPSNRWRLFHNGLLALAVFLIAQEVLGQSPVPEEPLSIERGVFGDVDEAMRNLLRLNREGNQIRLDRNWEQRLPDIPPDNRRQEMIDRMTESGADPAIIERMKRQLLDQADRLRAEPPEVQSFYGVADAHSGSVGRGMSRGTDRLRADFNGPTMAGSLHVTGDIIQVVFTEPGTSGRELRLTDDAAGGLVLSVNGDDLLFDFRQKSTGHCRLVVIGQDVSVFEATDFAAFVDQHPAAVDCYLVPVLNAFGVVPPLFKTTPEVQAAVLALLEHEREGPDSRFGKLVSDLDAASFETRTLATETLANEFPLWHDQIQNRLLERDSLSPEAIKRLQDILEAHPEKNDIFGFVRQFNLSGSAEYLVWLLEQSEPERRPAIIAKLQTLTGQTMGDDVAGWKSWLSASGQGKRP